MKDPCPICNNPITGYRMPAHLALEHECFEDGTDIKQQTLKSLDKKEDRVLFLLRKYPNTRSPHNWALDLAYIRWFSPNHLLVWDSNVKLYTPNPDSRGWTEEQIKFMLIELSGVERCRRKHQEHDRKYYHNPHDGTSTIQHPCILPPPEAQYQAQLVKQAYKDWAIGKSIKENVML